MKEKIMAWAAVLVLVFGVVLGCSNGTSTSESAGTGLFESKTIHSQLWEFNSSTLVESKKTFKYKSLDNICDVTVVAGLLSLIMNPEYGLTFAPDALSPFVTTVSDEEVYKTGKVRLVNNVKGPNNSDQVIGLYKFHQPDKGLEGGFDSVALWYADCDLTMKGDKDLGIPGHPHRAITDITIHKGWNMILASTTISGPDTSTFISISESEIPDGFKWTTLYYPPVLLNLKDLFDPLGE